MIMPPIISFKKPMPIVWRQHIEVADVIASEMPLPMVFIGSRLSAEYPANFPNTAYPQESRNNSEEGIVVLSIQVLESGRIGDVMLEKNSGYPRLDEAAMDYVRKHWRFTPELRDDVPVVDWKTVSIAFWLKQIEVRW